jgi:hypothetical protein
MVTVIGGNGVTLKKLMLRLGFPTPESAHSRSAITGVFNASFTNSQMVSRVPSWVRSVPMINKMLVTNKLSALQKMDAAGLGEHIPEYRTSTPAIYEEGWIIKPYASQAGRGIRKFAPMTLLPHGCYLQKDVVKFREFRAHVGLWLDKPCFTIQEKKPKEELWNATYPEGEHGYEWPLSNVAMRGFLPVTWNIESGFYFKRLTTPDNRAEKADRFPLIKRIEDVGIAAVKALGYQYGAVDILMDDARQLFIVEVNSHPAIKNEISKEIYNGALQKLSRLNKAQFRLLVGLDSTSTVTIRRPAAEGTAYV